MVLVALFLGHAANVVERNAELAVDLRYRMQGKWDGYREQNRERDGGYISRC